MHQTEDRIEVVEINHQTGPQVLVEFRKAIFGIVYQDDRFCVLERDVELDQTRIVFDCRCRLVLGGDHRRRGGGFLAAAGGKLSAVWFDSRSEPSFDPNGPVSGQCPPGATTGAACSGMDMFYNQADTGAAGPLAFGTPFSILCALSLVSFVIGPFAAAASLRHGLD